LASVLLQNLCFTKKIRYESRKQLAQARPRVKGQFVRMPSGAAEPSEADVILEAAEQPAPMQPGTAAIGIQLVVAAAQAVEVTNGAAPMADVEEVCLRHSSCKVPRGHVALLVEAVSARNLDVHAAPLLDVFRPQAIAAVMLQ